MRIFTWLIAGLLFSIVTVNAQRAEVPLLSSSMEESLVLAEIGQPLTEFLDIGNPTQRNVVCNVELDLERSIVPNGWQVSFENLSLTLAENSILSLPLSVIPVSDDQAELVLVVSDEAGTVIKEHSLSIITHLSEYIFFDTMHHDDAIGKIDQAMGKIDRHTKIDWVNQKAVWKFADDFEVYVFPIGGDMSGVLSVGVDGVTSPIPFIKHLIDQGKKILITSENDASLAFSALGTPEARQFFMEDLGLMAGMPQVRYETVEEERLPISFSLYGLQNDPFFGGLSATVNDWDVVASGAAETPFLEKTDILQVVENSGATPILYYDNAAQQVGGTRIEIGDARIIYLGFGLEGIQNDDQRAAVLESMIEWLRYGNLVSSVEEHGGEAAAAMRLSPNPANSSSVCSFSVAGTEIADVSVRVVDLRGNVQLEVHRGKLVPGDYSFAVDTSVLPIGQYNVVAEIGGRNISSPLMIVR